MFKKLASLFQPKERGPSLADRMPDRPVSRPAPAPSRPTGSYVEAINAAPDADSPSGQQLINHRRRAPIELQIAVTARVSAWASLISMGSPHGVNSAFLPYMLKAHQSDFEMKKILYTMVQNVIYDNCSTPAQVKAL